MALSKEEKYAKEVLNIIHKHTIAEFREKKRLLAIEFVKQQLALINRLKQAKIDKPIEFMVKRTMLKKVLVILQTQS